MLGVLNRVDKLLLFLYNFQIANTKTAICPLFLRYMDSLTLPVRGGAGLDEPPMLSKHYSA